MGTTALQKRKVPLRLKVRRCHSSSVRASTVAPELRMIVLPPDSVHQNINAATCRDGLLHYPCDVGRLQRIGHQAMGFTASAAYPIHNLLNSDLVEVHPTTVPPSAPIICAVARPIPLPAPEIRATLSWNRIAVLPLLYLYTVCTGLSARIFSWPQSTTPRNFSEWTKELKASSEFHSDTIRYDWRSVTSW